jgi:hypothetical protein
MSSITNVSTGEVSITDPLAIAYQNPLGTDVTVTPANPLPITGTITTTQGPIEYVDAGGSDVTVREGARPLPVSIESTIGSGPVEFKLAGGADQVVTAGAKLTALPVQSEGGVIDTVSTVTSVTDVANVQSVDLVDTVTTVSAVTSVATVNVVSENSKSINFHQNAAGAAIATGTNTGRGPVTERGFRFDAYNEAVVDVGPAPNLVASGGQGVSFYTAPTWVRFSHIGIMNNSAPGDVSIGIIDPASGQIAYSGEFRVMPSASLPGAASQSPREYAEPTLLAPGAQLAVWHSVPNSIVNVVYTVERLE